MRLWLFASAGGAVGVLVWALLLRFFTTRLPRHLPDAADMVSDPPPVSQSEGLAIFGVTLAAIALAVPLVTRGLTYDEIWSVLDFFSGETLWQVVSTFDAYNNHIFYSILARFSAALFGPTEWAYRLPALVFGVATIPAVWWFARTRFGPLVGLIAAAAIAMAAVEVGFSVTARGYTGLLLFSLLSSASFLHLVQKGGSAQVRFAYVLSTYLGAYTHLVGASVLFVQIVFLLALGWRETRDAGPSLLDRQAFRRVWTAMGFVAALIALSYMPVLRSLVTRLAATGSGNPFVPSFPLKVLGYLSGYGQGFSIPVTILSLTALVGLGWGWRKNRVEAAYVWALCLIPPGAIWLVRPENLKTRFLMFLLPYYVIGFALGLRGLIGDRGRALGKGRSRVWRSMGTILASALFALWVSRPWSSVPTGAFREAVMAMEAGLRPGVGLCAVGPGARFFSYYATVPILVPNSVEEFQRFAANHDEVRCAQWPGPSQPHHAEIEQILATRSHREQYHLAWVYRYRP